ncbi:MAG: biotin transporter BioY [Blautia massiliensis (ex Durand et al. 2017)]
MMSSASAARVRHMVLCALFAALTAICSQIAVPMPWGVPINLALFAVCMAGAMLGPVWGTASMVVFVALAAIGVPVLAGFQGGPAAIFGKTGGYAVGYILAALIVGLLTRKPGRRFLPLCMAMAAGCAACYALGTVWFMLLTHSPLVAALTMCVLPYLPADAIKIALAAVLVLQLDHRLPHRPV